MSTLVAILDRCCDPLGPNVDEFIPALLTHIPSMVSLPDVLRHHMGPYLLASDGKVRGRATSVLTGLLRSGGATILASSASPSVADGGAVAEALFEFFCGRLADSPSMSFAADGLLLLLTQYEEILPPDSASKFVATLASDVSVPSLDHATRHKLLSILRAITRSQKWLEDVGKEAKSFGSCVVLSVEGEKDPRCLVVALEVVQRTLRRISSDLVSADGGDSVLEELFDVAACYFPIAFTPPPNNPHGITREMLVDGLAAVFTSTFRIARFVMPLLFEKLSSAIVSAKLDALSALKLCIRAYGATALLPYVREICDVLRGEVIHGSDEAVTKAALETITALVSALTAHADDLPVTDEATVLPGWHDVESNLVRVSTEDILRSPDALLGRSGLGVLTSVSSASGFAFVKVLAQTMVPLVNNVFVKKQDVRTGAVAALDALTQTIPPRAFTYSPAVDVLGLLSRVTQALSSVLAAPGDCDARCVCSAARGVVNLATVWPRGTDFPSPHVVTHIVSLFETTNAQDIKQCCSESLERLCRVKAELAVVCEDALPRLLAVVTSVGSGPRVGDTLALLKRLCDVPDVYRVVVPQLVAYCTSVGSVTDALRTLVAIVSSSGAIQTSPALVNTLCESPNSMFPFLAKLSLTQTEALDLCYTVAKTVHMFGSRDVQSQLQTFVASCVLRKSDDAGLAAVYGVDPMTVPLMLSLRWLPAVLCSKQKSVEITSADALTRQLVDSLTTSTAPTAADPLIFECLTVLLNRLAKHVGCQVVISYAVEGLVHAGVTDANPRALRGLVATLKGLLFAGHSNGELTALAFRALCDLLKSSGDGECVMLAGDLVSTLLVNNVDALQRQNGATLSPGYHQRVFAWAHANLAADLLPGMMTSPALQALCGLLTQLPPTAFAEWSQKMLPIVLTALSQPADNVRVVAVSALQLYTKESVDVLAPHLSAVVPVLVQLACKGAQATIRADALECLTRFTTLPFHQVNIVRPMVVRGLVPALDDPKRAVRRRAVACRNEWITLSTTTV